LAVESLTPSTLVSGDGVRVTPARLFVKRVLSLVIALAELAVRAPFTALVALLIVLEMPGSAFFIQERLGLRGRTFRLIKFRTMRVEDTASGDTIVRDDEIRVTRVGAVLRRILRGHLSLIAFLTPRWWRTSLLQPPPRSAAGEKPG
jgi:lipopolysaccharide/colanic/teichoic acid biosynthesis glycosyltransferase